MRESGSGSSPKSNSLHPSASMTSPSSIASDPNNYLSDKELREDLVVEEMRQREHIIGNGSHRTENGVGDLAASPENVRASDVPPSVGVSAILKADLENGSISPPVPFMGAANGNLGLAHQPVPQMPPTSERIIAERMLATNESSAVQGEQKKSSKQRFEERQVRPHFKYIKLQY